MTVASVYVPAQYAGNGVTTTFAVAFNFFVPSDLVVSLFNTTTNAPVVPAPVLNGAGAYDYTVTGTQDPDTGEYLSGGSVVANTALPANYTITIALAVSPTQNVALTNNAPFPAKTIEAALDRATMVIQQQTVPVTTVVGLPPPGTRGRRGFVTDATSTTFGAAPVGAGSDVVPVFDNGTAWVIG